MARSRAGAAILLGASAWLALAQTQGPPTSTPVAPATQPADAQTGPTSAPVATAPAYKSLLDFRELSFDIGFESSLDQRWVHQDTHQWFQNQFKQTNRADRFEETVGTHASGAIVDERVMQFDMAARWGLTQEWFRETGTSSDLTDRSHGDILEYDLNLNILPRGKISADVFASHLNSRVPRTFLPSLDRTVDRYGANVYVNDRTFPMRFSFEHVWDTLTSRTRNLDDDEQRGHDAFQYEGTWQISENHSLRLQYEHNERTEQFSGTRTRYDTTRDYLVLNHMLRFGPDGRSSLETIGRFQNEQGQLGRDNAELSTRLRLQHTDSLASFYGAQFLQDSFENLTAQTWRGEAGLTHQLGDVLTTTAQIYGLRQHANENADFTEFGGLLSSAFSKENALGRLSANVTYNHTTTDTDDGTHRGVVIGESVTLRDPLPTFLAKTDVKRFSVIVTDADRTRTYLIGRDYLLIPVGRYTAIQRVPTGQIADRQTVLVSYTYGVSESYRINRDRLEWRIQQDFKFGLTPYYAGSIQNEDIDNSRYLRFASLQARNVNRQRVGATFRQPRWSVGAEYEYNDDSIDPYDALHFNGDVVLWQSARHQLDGKATLERFWFSGSDGLRSHDTTLLDVGATYRYLIAQYLEANVTALYRFEDDSINGRTNGVDLTAGLDWKIGLFALRFEADYDRLSLPGSGDENFSLWIKLRREIPVIARKE